MSIVRKKLTSSLTHRLRSKSYSLDSAQRGPSSIVKEGSPRQPPSAEQSPSAPSQLSSAVQNYPHSPRSPHLLHLTQSSGGPAHLTPVQHYHGHQVLTPYQRSPTRSLSPPAPPPLPPPIEGQINQKRYKVLSELVATEISYVKALGRMLESYKEPMQSVLSDSEVATIFSIAELLYDFHSDLSEGLQERLEQWSDESEVGAFFLEKVAFLRSYSAYVNNYTIAVNTLAACEGKGDFIEFMKTLRGQATDDGQPLQSLYSYLVMPIQRVPRYLLLLEQLRVTTPTEHPDYLSVQKVIDIVSEIMVYIDTKRQLYESKLRLAALSMTIQRLPDDLSIIKPHRSFKSEAEMTLVNDEKPVVVFLFSDALFITEAQQNSRFSRSGSSFTSSSASSSASSTSSSAASSSSSSSSPSASLPSVIRRRSPSGQLALKAGKSGGSSIEGMSRLSAQTNYNYIDSVCLDDRSKVTLRCYVDGLVYITTDTRETPIVLQHLSSISGNSDSSTPVPPLSTSGAASHILFAELCELLGIELPESLPRDPSIFENLAPIETVKRRRGSFIQAFVAAHSPSRASNHSTNSNQTGVDDLSVGHASSATSSARRKLLTRSEPTASTPLRTRIYSSVTPPSTPAGQLSYHDLAYRTLAEAGFVPMGAVALPDLQLSWQDVGYVGESNDFVSFVPGFYYELGTCRVRSELSLPPFFMFPDNEIPFYEANFVGKEHTHMFGCTQDRADWVIASIELDPPEHAKCRRIVLRTKYGEHRFLIPISAGNPTSKTFGARLERECPEILQKELKWVQKASSSPVLLAQQSLSPRARSTLTDRLVEYDRGQREMVLKLKIGVVPTRPGDMVSGSDRRIFNNSEPSPDFQEFLDFLGDVVVLKDYAGFAGGLDTTNDLTGTISLTTSFASAVAQFEIMFHVSTMLPHKESDEQQLAKKRHVGNDIVVVVFHEDHQPFDPTVFVSKMNQAFIVVKKSGTNPEGVPTYRIAFVCKQQAPSFPVIPEGAEFLADRNLHRFLIAKIINAEATTHHSSPTFVARNIRARSSALQEIATLY